MINYYGNVNVKFWKFGFLRILKFEFLDFGKSFLKFNNIIEVEENILSNYLMKFSPKCHFMSGQFLRVFKMTM